MTVPFEGPPTPAEQQWRADLGARRDAVATALGAFAVSGVWWKRLYPLEHALCGLIAAFDCPWHTNPALMDVADPRIDTRGVRILLELRVAVPPGGANSDLDVYNMRTVPSVAARTARAGVDLTPLCCVGNWLYGMFNRALKLWRDANIDPREWLVIADAQRRLQQYRVA